MTTSTPVRRGASALALAAVLALATACGGSGSSKSGTGATTTTGASTTAAAPASTTTASTVTTAGPTTTTTSSTTATTGPATTTTSGGTTTPGLSALPTGTHYVYFTGISQGSIRGQAVSLVTFDKVDFLTGKAAVDAAHADGVIPPGQDYVENDYYIRNKNKALRTMAVVPDAQVFVVGCGGGCTTPEPSSIDIAAGKTTQLFKILVQNVGSDSTITSVEGVFLP